MLIKLNVTIAVYRERSILRENPLLEVIGFTAITAAISYLVRTIFKYCSDGTLRGIPDCVFEVSRRDTLFTIPSHIFCDRVQSSELVSSLFQECDPTKVDFHGLCKWVLYGTPPSIDQLIT